MKQSSEQSRLINVRGGMDANKDPLLVSSQDSQWQMNVWSDQEGRLIVREGLKELEIE